MSKQKEQTTNPAPLTRRGFIAGAGAAALSFTIVKPSLVRGTAANSKINVGLIGSGGRGVWIAEQFAENGGYNVVAGADYFQDRLDKLKEKLAVKDDSLYTGLYGYRKLLERKDVDAVAIETPPYFHPEQAAAAIDAGKHVYLAKPVAIDVPGCKSIGQSGKKATAKKLCFRVDFQTRAMEFYREAIRRVHAGALGNFAFGESIYHTGQTWQHGAKFIKDDPLNPENRLRAWGLFHNFSGDIITEQNIHALDVTNWIMNTEPISAVGMGGRKVRQHNGDCWDWFAIVFEYPDNVGVSFTSKQFKGYDSPGGIINRMFGSKGVLETKYGGQVLIRGENFYRGGRTNEIGKKGVGTNIAEFHDNIVNARYENTTVAQSVRSNLLTILGRTAAYKKEKINWATLMKSTERFQPNLKGLKA